MIISSIQVVDLWWLAKGYFQRTFGLMDRYFYYPSKLMTCGDSPRRIISWLFKLWIDDPIIHRSPWLVVSCREGFFLDFWNCRSMILSSTQVVDLWTLFKPKCHLTFGIKDRWSYHPSKSLTCGDSSSSIYTWRLELWIDDPVIHPCRWLVVIRQVGLTKDFWNYGSMILSSIQVFDM